MKANRLCVFKCFYIDRDVVAENTKFDFFRFQKYRMLLFRMAFNLLSVIGSFFAESSSRIQLLINIGL